MTDSSSLYAHVQGWCGHRHYAFISVNGQKVVLQELANKGVSAIPADLGSIDTIHLTVACGRHPASLCDTQDILFYLFEAFSPGQLRELNVSISVSMPDESRQKMLYAMLHPDTNSAGTLTGQHNEFDEIERGDISRLHATAFLADPLCLIRGLKDGKWVGKFSLNFKGNRQQPWKYIMPRLRELIRSNEPVHEYSMFQDCYSHIREVCALLESSVEGDKKMLSNIRHQLQICAVDRIRGDVLGFEIQYARLLDFIKIFVQQRLPLSEGSELKQRVREIERRLLKLENTIPSLDADVSFLGYRMADALLPEKEANGEEMEIRRLHVNRRWVQILDVEDVNVDVEK